MWTVRPARRGTVSQLAPVSALRAPSHFGSQGGLRLRLRFATAKLPGLRKDRPRGLEPSEALMARGVRRFFSSLLFEARQLRITDYGDAVADKPTNGRAGGKQPLGNLA